MNTDAASVEKELLACGGDASAMAFSYMADSQISTALNRLLSPDLLPFDNYTRITTSFPIIVLNRVDATLTDESCDWWSYVKNETIILKFMV